jgi:hypothetical protein
MTSLTFNFSEMTTQGGYFAYAFNASKLHQIWQNLHANAHLTFLYNLVWSIQADCQHNSRDVGLKGPPLAALNCQIWLFMVPTLKQRLRSFPAELRA